MNAAKQNQAAPASKHPFALAGYPGPYKVLGPVELVYQACPGVPAQPGGTCNVCSTGFRYGCKFEDANGTKFITGCDCAAKAFDDYDSKTAAELRKMRRDMVNAGSRAKSAAKRAEAAARREEMRAEQEAILRGKCDEIDFDILAKIAHSKEWAAEKGQSAADEVNYWLKDAKNFRRGLEVAEEHLAAYKAGDFTPVAAPLPTPSKDAKHIGAVKDRLVFKGTCVAKIWFETFYGSSCIVKVITEDGDIVGWKTSAPWGIATPNAEGEEILNVGDKVQFKATVKSHDKDSYNADKPVTWVARAKAFTPKAKKARKAKA